MEQHAIPTNVSSYQFKLVGDMTLKQFFQVAGGVLGAVIFYSTPLLPIIKYPLAGLSVILGVCLAFLPLEERPLERWIFAFFRAIYSPTLFSWKRGSVSSKLFQDESTETQNTHQETALKDYLDKTGAPPNAKGNLDKAEGNFFKNLTHLFNTAPQPKPDLGAPDQNTQSQQPVQTLKSEPIPVQNAQPPAPPPVPLGPVNTHIQPDVKIPANNPVQVPLTVQNPIPNPQSLYAAPNPAMPIPVTPTMAGTNIISTTQALFSVDAAPPSPPTYPNVVVGQVIDQDRKIVEGVIMEIKDSNGRPIRALRSNKVGHFITVTQLDNGHYEIITEKDGYEFAPVSFDATGTIIEPILVRGKRLSQFIEMPATPVKPAYSIN